MVFGFIFIGHFSRFLSCLSLWARVLFLYNQLFCWLFASFRSVSDTFFPRCAFPFIPDMCIIHYSLDAYEFLNVSLCVCVIENIVRPTQSKSRTCTFQTHIHSTQSITHANERARTHAKQQCQNWNTQSSEKKEIKTGIQMGHGTRLCVPLEWR